MAHHRLVTPKKLAVGGQGGEEFVQAGQVADFGNKCGPALLGSLKRMGLQAVLADAFGVGVAGLHGDDAGGTKFGGLFDDEIGAGFFDWGEGEPKVGRQAQRRGLMVANQDAAAFASLGNFGAPFTVAAIEQGHGRAARKPHHVEKIVGLICIDGHGLPMRQSLIYIEADFCICHAGESMSEFAEKPEATVADAPKDNWVDRFAPPAMRPYLRLSRADRPIGTWLLLIPCWWGIALAGLSDGFRAWDLWLALSAALGAFLMRGAGCTWNDIADREIDASVARTRSRPLPSGAVTVQAALVWMAVQAALAAVILLTYNRLAIGLGVASLALVLIYPFAKRFTWWPQAFLGLAFNWGAVLVYAAHAGELRLPAVLLYGAGIAWTLFYDTIYAHQDREDDALIGVKSTARLFGDNSRVWLRGFMGVSVVLMAGAVIAVAIPADRVLALILALAGVWGFGWHMAWQLRRLNIDDPAQCRRLFLSNRDAGLIPALFLAAAAFL